MASKIKIHFLGTSAQIPTAKRNHSAILLNYKDENILFDCGEGTQRQFRKAQLNPCRLTKILITHIHGDHIFGLPGLLSTLNFSGYNKELHIYCPRGSKKIIEEFIDLEHLKNDFKIKIEEVSGKFYESEEFYLEAESMQHGIPTNAYNFVIKSQFRIDKSKLKKYKIQQGPLLKKIKQGKDIMYNGKKYKAKDLLYGEKGKKISIVLKEHLHLTAKQCGEIAKAANAGKLILTHISQRYENNLKELLDDAKSAFKNVVIAEDFSEFEI
ncbi:MAG: MBL fold metallo-hydrolase [Candidatus Pacearchaeota archaeon]|nr:MBL fold metallo-hydrolase [Candidatus Pacearchaeota archaeon]